MSDLGQYQTKPASLYMSAYPREAVVLTGKDTTKNQSPASSRSANENRFLEIRFFYRSQGRTLTP